MVLEYNVSAEQALQRLKDGNLEYLWAQPQKSLKLENRDKKVYSNNGDENVDNSRRI